MKINDINTKEGLLEAVKEVDRMLDEGREIIKEYRGKTDEEIGVIKFLLVMEIQKQMAGLETARLQICMKLDREFDIHII